jgi:hypothetical protein
MSAIDEYVNRSTRPDGGLCIRAMLELEARVKELEVEVKNIICVVTNHMAFHVMDAKPTPTDQELFKKYKILILEWHDGIKHSLTLKEIIYQLIAEVKGKEEG